VMALPAFPCSALHLLTSTQHTRWMASTASQAAWLPPQGTHNISIGSSIRRSLSKDNRAQQANHPSQPLRNDFVALRCQSLFRIDICPLSSVYPLLILPPFSESPR